MNEQISKSRRRILKLLSGSGVLALVGGHTSMFAASGDGLKPRARDLAEQYGVLTHYGIFRKGKRIGTHEVRINRSGANLNVSVESNIRVTVLKVPVFTFKYVGEEIWLEDRLHSVSGNTTENRSVTDVSMNNEEELSRLVTADGTQTVERLSFASNHWNANVVGSQRIFNTITGKASNINMQALGEEKISTGLGTITANRFKISGEIQADVWYDAEFRWVRLSFLGKDGSQIDYLIE